VNCFWPSRTLAGELETESVSIARRVAKSGPGSQPPFSFVNPKKAAATALETVEHKLSEARSRAAPPVAGDGERHDRFGVIVGEGLVEQGKFLPTGKIHSFISAPPSH
jgi:hypothetical protein